MSLALTSLATASRAAESADPSGPNGSNEPKALEEVVVTGSRIARAGFEEPTPVTVVGAAELQQKAVDNVADVLSQIPAFRQTSGSGQAQRLSLGGGGESLVDLRGLGPNRTLVLMDGQRVVATNITGTVDVNLIPAFMIDRVDVVTGGASAAYGADAVAGVVNFVLRKKLDGIELNSYYGQSDYHDNKERVINIAAGHDFLGGRLHVLAGADYHSSGGVGSIYERSWGREEPGIFGTGSPRAAGVPSQLLAVSAELNNITSGGIINAGPLKGIAFGPGGTPYQFGYGQLYSTWMTGNQNNYETNTFGHWPLKVPLDRVTSLLKVSFDATDSLSLFANVAYSKSQEHGFGSFHQWPAIIINANNPFLPASVAAQMTTLHLPSITIGRNSQDINGGFQVDNSDDVARVSIGAQGELFQGWHWDAYLGWGRSKVVVDSPDLAFLPNFFAATYAVPGPNGQPVCGPPQTNPNLTAVQRGQVQPNCVPLNLFGYGSPSQAAIDYVTGDLVNRYTLEQRSAGLNVQSHPFSTWAGRVDVAAGAEWRRDSVDSDLDPGAILNEWYSANALPLIGSNKVTEVYAETVVPLLKDLPLARSLELNGAVRYTDYQTSGSVVTWKAGLSYDIDGNVRFRGTRSRDIRAPTLSELFTQLSGSRAGLINPFNGQSSAITTNTAGNRQLVPEVADTNTVGVVWEPKQWLDGLSISADYYTIKVKNVITTLTPQQILTACAAGIQQYCASITFDTSVFGISSVTSQPFNGSELDTDGVDLEVAYRLPDNSFGIPGRLSFRSLATKVLKLESIAANGTFDYAGVAQNGVPAWTFRFSTVYDWNRLSLNADVHGFSALKFDTTLIGPDDPRYSPSLPNSININRFPSATYVDLGARYSLIASERHTLQLFANVDNTMNKVPPVFAAIAINSGGNPYDLIGRTYRVGFRLKY
jgi:outer membrane receptor protein involved in Fe transport